MNDQNKENLKGLFEGFLDTEQADEAAKDVQKGEQMLREHPSPEPDNKLIAEIKLKIAGVLLARKANTLRRMAYKAAVVAAVLIILAAVSVKLFEKSKDQPVKLSAALIIPKTIWESEDITVDDSNLAVLTAEIEQAEREILALQLGENGGNGKGAIMELEMEIIETNSGDFWKG